MTKSANLKLVNKSYPDLPGSWYWPADELTEDQLLVWSSFPEGLLREVVFYESLAIQIQPEGVVGVRLERDGEAALAGGLFAPIENLC